MSQLLKQLEEVTKLRKESEKNREETVKTAKANSTKLNQRRAAVRDIWKKKYFDEKKKTHPLEGVCLRLRTELDNKQQRFMKDLGKVGKSPHRKHQLPSLKNNGKIQVTKLHHDIDVIKRQVERAKIKLTGEIKLRHQAEKDVKNLRQELLTKKIRAHIAYRDLERTRNFRPRKSQPV